MRSLPPRRLRPVPSLTGLALCLLLTMPAAAEEVPLAPPVPASVEELRSELNGLLAAGTIPAAGIVLYRDGAPELVDGLGVADRASGAAADAHTRFRIGSITKTFLAIAIMQEVEAGRLSLDDRLAELVPEMPIDNPWEATDPLRLVHLLEHTAGFDDMHFRRMQRDPQAADTRAQMAQFGPEFRVRWRPGERMAYSNPGYGLAAYILEKRTGQRAEQLIDARVLAPLGMHDTVWQRPAERLALGYARDSGAVEVWDEISMPAAGALSSTAHDMARFLAWHLQADASLPALISEASRARIERGESALSARLGVAGYGLGNYAIVRGDRELRGHGGGIPGYAALFGYSRAERIGFVALFNSIPGRDGRKVHDLLVRFAARDLPPPAALAVSVPEPRWEGWYAYANPRNAILGPVESLLNAGRLSVVDGKLQMRHALVPQSVDFEVVGDGLLRDPGLIRINGVLGRDADGRDVLITDDNVFVRGSWASVALPQYAVAAALLLLVSVLLVAPFWLVSTARGRLRGAAHAHDRWWPLLAVAALALSVLGASRLSLGALVQARPDLPMLLVMLGSLAFGVFAALGSVQTLRHWRRAQRRVAHGYAALVSLAALALALWLWRIDLLGIRLWAY